MKTLQESIIGKRGSTPLHIPRNPKDIEGVSGWKTLSDHSIEFDIELPNIKRMGLDDVTDRIYDLVFRRQTVKPNLTQWVMNNDSLEDYVDDYKFSIRFLKPSNVTKFATVANALGFIVNRSPLFEDTDRGIRDHIYKIVCDFDGRFSLDNIKMKIRYTFNKHIRKQLTGVIIFLN